MMDGRKNGRQGVWGITSKQGKYIFFHCLLRQSERKTHQHKRGAFYHDRTEKKRSLKMAFTILYTEIIISRTSCVRRKNILLGSGDGCTGST